MAVTKAFIVEDGKTKVVVNPHLGVDHALSDNIKHEFNKTSDRHKNFFYIKEEGLEDAKVHINDMVAASVIELKGLVFKDLQKAQENVNYLLDIVQDLHKEDKKSDRAIDSIKSSHSIFRNAVTEDIKALRKIKPSLQVLILIQTIWLLALNLWVVYK